ncbi:hypothetical protein BDN72DRAFT_941109 [Pluteus cervinus]|uniref:Uncharacterized protein n=1 Tax=Pluteus cervinus TaxID=181527 RepID=A0ACD3A3A1_9AGAR|nr:hypothetical protein BDN72DRAFT_941109 [Pluteus cervinus]
MEVDDDIDPAAHTQMDAAVLGDPSLHHHVQLDLQPDPAHLLALVVLKCKDMAHKIDQSYANMGNARLLTDGNPDVTKLVEDAWSARAFKRIRLLAVLRLPATPNTAFPNLQTTPRKDPSATQDQVTGFFRTYEARLRKYLTEKAWNDYWKAPELCNPAHEHFINDLEIPKVMHDPMLLLHNIGNGIVDKAVLSSLFDGKSKFLVNTSGSGKTRLLIEGLSSNWGFYLTAAKQTAVQVLGSIDVMEAISLHIPQSTGFTEDPQNLAEHLREEAFRHNHLIARRRMHQIITARVVIFEHFLKTAQEIWPDRSIHDFRQHWLFLQLRPLDILKKDIFADLTRLLNDASDSFLMMSSLSGVDTKLLELQSTFELQQDIVCVLDEAQFASGKLTRAFRSEQKPDIKRPVLSRIVNAWSTSTERPMIVSGTEVSIELVLDPKLQYDYIARYMPVTVLESESGKEFLKRAWKWVRGRHRFTASLLSQFLKLLFQSPHKILNAYVKAVCNFEPTDGELSAEQEPDAQLSVIPLPFDFTKIHESYDRLSTLSDVLYTWLTLRKYVPLTESKKQLVQYGFAPFHQGEKDSALVDEPLVFLAAAQEFRTIKDLSMEAHVTNRLVHSEGRGAHFEQFLAIYLASTFSDGCKLSDVFEFAPDVPQWADQEATVVSVDRDGERRQVYPFNLRDRVGGTSGIGFKCSDVDDTWGWFKHLSTLLCFPDIYMGPDVALFARLSSGLVISIVIQIKWNNNILLPRTVRLDATSTVNPAQFYEHKVRQGHCCAGTLQHIKQVEYSVAREDILAGFDDTKPDPEMTKWFEKDSPVLRVIASYPAAVREESLGPCISLDMAKCQNLFDKDRVLKTVADSLEPPGRSKRRVEGDADDPSKKQKK